MVDGAEEWALLIKIILNWLFESKCGQNRNLLHGNSSLSSEHRVEIAETSHFQKLGRPQRLSFNNRQRFQETCRRITSFVLIVGLFYYGKSSSFDVKIDLFTDDFTIKIGSKQSLAEFLWVGPMRKQIQLFECKFTRVNDQFSLILLHHCRLNLPWSIFSFQHNLWKITNEFTITITSKDVLWVVNLW